MSKAKHRGLREYTSEEAGNAALGQLGFEVLSAGANTGYWNCIKVIGGAAAVDVDLDIVSSQGDNVTLVNVLTGEIFYGAFTSITVANIGTNIKVLAYHAK